MLNHAHFDFGYPWWLSYGHLALLAPAALLLFAGYRRKWSKWPMLFLGAFALWSAAAFLSVQFVLDLNGTGTLPTQSFMPLGSGRILDLGAGTGRSSIMVLEARPQTTLVALDLFSDSFDEHFGPGLTPQARLQRNLKAAGVEQRVTLQTADMRQLPFPDGSFDGVVSCYAIDHLNQDGIRKTLHETARVLKPGGDFLLMIVGKDPWVQFAFGPLLLHGGNRGPDWWNRRVKESGFQILEQGMRPATYFVLARRPHTQAPRSELIP